MSKDLGRKYRRRLTLEENESLDRSRGIQEQSDSHNMRVEDVKHLWVKNQNSSVFVKNPNFISPEDTGVIDVVKEALSSMKGHEPKFPILKRKTGKDKRLLVVDPADIHIGKLAEKVETGEDYDNNIAVQRVMEGVDGILNESNPDRIDKILFVGGNDILHVDNTKRSTTAGTSQDTVGMWHSNFLIAKDLYVKVLETLISVADVHFVFNPSNHDYTQGYFLAQVIETYFRKCENITFDCSIQHRKYFRYFNNIIGCTHGDGAKTTDLPLLMAHEAPKDWAETKHRYVYTHHVHHKVSKDYMSVNVESLRTPSGTDAWHDRNGYSHNVKAVEGFLHHKEHGQLQRITHIF